MVDSTLMRLCELFYLLSASALAIYGFNSIFHCLIYWRCKRFQKSTDGDLRLSVEPSNTVSAQLADAPSQQVPKVTVQLPLFNERHVASRLLDAVLALDWPSECLQIQLLDDSTDDTSQIISASIGRLDLTQVEVQHVRRPDRNGFKAGALQYGLNGATGEFIAIFDADFIPQPDFLRRTIPRFSDPGIGCVQTRWDHVNPHSSMLTEAQALGIDGHFKVEQFVRDRIGAFLNFNGTAGVWRRASMEEAGGWQHDTLTEDLDLSYRAQLSGWRIAFEGDVAVPAELPVQVNAFKRQQFRWAKGSLQTAIKLLPRLWRAPGPGWRKILGTLHLTNYMVHPFMVLNLLLLLPISSSQSPVLHIAPFLTTAAIGPPLMYWLSMDHHSSASLWSKIHRLAILMALGTGLSINNSKAAYEAWLGIDSDFKRTPKFDIRSIVTEAKPEKNPAWQNSSYALPQNPIVWIELGLALFATYLLIYCIQIGVWWILIWILMYAVGYGYIALLSFVQSWQLRTAQTASLAAAIQE